MKEKMNKMLPDRLMFAITTTCVVVYKYQPIRVYPKQKTQLLILNEKKLLAAAFCWFRDRSASGPSDMGSYGDARDWDWDSCLDGLWFYN